LGIGEIVAFERFHFFKTDAFVTFPELGLEGN
jgi:hypothetical protein